MCWRLVGGNIGGFKFGGLLDQVVTRNDSESGVKKSVPGKVVGICFAWFTVGEIWGYRAFCSGGVSCHLHYGKKKTHF